jgi:L-threonylcarbamoyladenylate synthase
MKARVLPDLLAAARVLAGGDLVAFPTETVYGLGADATNAAAVAKVFALKGRPADHPVIVHLASGARLENWATDIPESARKLVGAYWPGPLTIILKKTARIPAIVTGGQDTVGLRCPSHPVAQELLREFARIGSGVIAAPSANRFGRVSPTTAQHVRDEFGPDLPVIDGGACDVGIESTIVDLSRGPPFLLRPGAITRGMLAATLGAAPRERDDAAPRASGTLTAHYAPETPLLLLDRASLDATLREPGRPAVLARRPAPGDANAVIWIAAPDDPARYAHDLYANLRVLDASGAGRILVEAAPESAAWEAVNDRLRRAQAGASEEDET